MSEEVKKGKHRQRKEEKGTEKNGEITRTHNYLAISEEPLEMRLRAIERILEYPLLLNISSVKVIFGEFPLLGAQPQHDDAI